MRTVFLLRHGMPSADGGTHRCLGQRSDPALSAEGSAAAAALAAALRRWEISATASSPLLRCRQTAAALFPQRTPVILPDMAELDCGVWDGLTFAEIRTRWPELYALRAQDQALPPPGGEQLAHAAARGLAALRGFLAATEGSVAVVGHSGINRAMLCALTNTPFSRSRSIPQPYLCINRLRFDGGELIVDGLGLEPDNPALWRGEEFRNERTV